MKKHVPLSERARERVAARFRALGEPTRLKILEVLFDREASVGEVVEVVGGTQANVSKHLVVLYGEGLITRRKDGTRTLYALADPSIERICGIVCDSVGRDAVKEAEAIAGTPRPTRER